MRYPYDTSYRDGQSLLRYPGTRIVYGLLMLALLLAPWVLPRYFVGEITYVFIMCVVSLGLMVLVGYTGQVSLGQSAFVCHRCLCTCIADDPGIKSDGRIHGAGGLYHGGRRLCHRPAGDPGVRAVSGHGHPGGLPC